MGRVIAIVLIVCLAVEGQELTNDLVENEDDLRAALEQGEITREQYEFLVELLAIGLAEQHLHWLDLIPNLTHFDSPFAVRLSSLQQQQRGAFATTKPSMRSRYTSRVAVCLDASDRVSYVQDLALALDSHWRTEVTVRRTLEGRERFTQRSLGYFGNGRVRELCVGNYSRRLGLGVAVGHAAKRLGFDSTLSRESFLFPDRGGYNGLYTRTRLGAWRVESMASFNRDSTYAMTTLATGATRRRGRWRPGVILASSNLVHRANDSRLHDLKTSLVSEHVWHGTAVKFEACQQWADFAGPAAAVVEVAHRNRNSQILLAGWVYGDRLIDLTVGAKASRLPQAKLRWGTGLALPSHRLGQEGVMLRTLVDISPRWQLVNSLIYAGRNATSHNLEWLPAVVYRPSEHTTWRCDYLGRTRARGPGTPDREARRRWRVQGAHTTEALAIRSHLTYNTADDRSDYLSLQINIQTFGWERTRVKLSSNLSRWNAVSHRIEYWYSRLSVAPDMGLAGTRMKTTFTHAYSASGSPARSVTVAAELRVDF